MAKALQPGQLKGFAKRQSLGPVVCLSRNPSTAELTEAIEAVYRQLLGRQPLASEQLVDAESQFRKGQLCVADFVAKVAGSELFLSRLNRMVPFKAAAAAHPMSESAQRGRELFFGKANCTACDVGANLADEKYHNIGIGMDKREPDLGRFAVTKDPADTGAFKTPTVRNVALTAPYMHDGSVATLEEVVEWYDKGGHANPHLSDKIKPLNLTKQEQADLVEFMKACTSPTTPVETGRLPAAADL